MEETKFLNKNYESELISKSIKLLKIDLVTRKSSEGYNEVLDEFKSYIEYVENKNDYQKSKDMNKLLVRLKYYRE